MKFLPFSEFSFSSCVHMDWYTPNRQRLYHGFRLQPVRNSYHLIAYTVENLYGIAAILKSISYRLYHIESPKGINEVRDEFGQFQSLHEFSNGDSWITDAYFPSNVTLTEDLLLTTEKIEGSRSYSMIHTIESQKYSGTKVI